LDEIFAKEKLERVKKAEEEEKENE